MSEYEITGFEQPEYEFDESDIIGVPVPPPKKKKPKTLDKRAQSSKANIVKALQARKKKKEEEFEIEDADESEDSMEFEREPPKRLKKKIVDLTGDKQKHLYNEQQMQELRNIVNSLAHAQKKSLRQKKKTIINIPHPSAPVQIPEKKDKQKEQMKSQILRF